MSHAAAHCSEVTYNVGASGASPGKDSQHKQRQQKYAWGQDLSSPCPLKAGIEWLAFIAKVM